MSLKNGKWIVRAVPLTCMLWSSYDGNAQKEKHFLAWTCFCKVYLQSNDQTQIAISFLGGLGGLELQWDTILIVSYSDKEGGGS